MNNLQLDTSASKQKQQGFSLIMALGFMVFLTLIVLSMVNVTSSDEKIARNSRDKDIAFAAAEAALRDAEMYISGSYRYPYAPQLTANQFSPNCAGGLCDFRLAAPTNLGTLDFFDPGNTLGSESNFIGVKADGVTPTTYSPQIYGVAKQPRYLIEVVQTNDISGKSPYAYRITAQSVGKSADTRVTLQELYNPLP